MLSQTLPELSKKSIEKLEIEKFKSQLSDLSIDLKNKNGEPIEVVFDNL